MVNKLCLFSNNEEIEEVATNEIKYVLYVFYPLAPIIFPPIHKVFTQQVSLETVKLWKHEQSCVLGTELWSSHLLAPKSNAQGVLLWS